MMINKSPSKTLSPLPELSFAKTKTSAPEIPNAKPITFKRPRRSFKIHAAIKTIRIGVISNKRAA